MREAVTVATLALLLISCNRTADYKDWKVKGGTSDGLQYSSLDEITTTNVNDLSVAWIYSTHDADTVNNRTQIQCNPIVVDGILYGTSPLLKAFALDAATGREIWKFNPSLKNESLGVNRGVTYWSKGNDKRILYSYGENLYALDARTGLPIKSFGNDGKVSLKEGLGARSANLMVLSNTPGVIFKDLIIMGSRVHEGPVAAPGYIRAFDVKRGTLIWTFHTIPLPGEFGYDTWPAAAWKKIGGANAWSGMTVDEKRGVVFAGTGSASFDFYGGNREGKNVFANCVVALDAETGMRKWHYQIVHHDLWDRDLPAPPVLVSITHNGHRVDAVAQVTKTGFVYLFDRQSGEPIFPIREIPVDRSDLEGENAWPTQPIPTKPPPFARQAFTKDMINSQDPRTEDWIKSKFKGLRTGHQFIPPSKEGTIIFPGFDGGAEWGGASFDPMSGVLYINANEMPWILTMIDVRMDEKTWKGISLYRTNCATCHGLERKGDGRVFPPIDQLQKIYTKDRLKEFILKGKGVMPAFTQLNERDRDAIARYVLEMDHRTNPGTSGGFEPEHDILFSNTGYNRFLTPDGYPAVKPPWGTLNAIDLNNGTIKWQVPLGELDELKKRGIPATGTENYGGSVVTAGGLVFIAATKDEKIRAFDKRTGILVWEFKLPAGGYATPAVFQINGKEMLVVACGGGKMQTRSGDRYVAFSLGKRKRPID